MRAILGRATAARRVCADGLAQAGRRTVPVTGQLRPPLRMLSSRRPPYTHLNKIRSIAGLGTESSMPPAGRAASRPPTGW